MSGLTRKCRQGESFSIGSATVRVVKTGAKATLNIVAPPEVDVVFHKPNQSDVTPLSKRMASNSELAADRSTTS